MHVGRSDPKESDPKESLRFVDRLDMGGREKEESKMTPRLLAGPVASMELPSAGMSTLRGGPDLGWEGQELSDVI